MQIKPARAASVWQQAAGIGTAKIRKEATN